MSFLKYLREGVMSDLHVEIQDNMEQLVPEYIEDDGSFNASGLAFQIIDMYDNLSNNDEDWLMDLAQEVYERMKQEGEV